MGCREPEPSVTFVFTGDLMPDRGIRRGIEQKGIEPLFRNLPYDLNAVDYTVANLECAVCDSKALKVEKRFAFRANPEWLPGFRKQGINIVSLANNHSGDYGESGWVQTLTNVRRSDMYAVGANQDPLLAGAPLVISSGKIKVALFASDFLKSDSRYMCRASALELEKRIRNFKAGHPQTVVVLLLHWGVEGKGIPTTGQVKEAHGLVDAGVDVLVGTHPHVVQPVEHYKTGLIFYSLGNFIFDNNLPPQNKGMMVRLAIGQGHVVAMDTVTFNVYSGYGR
jgi:poly-gamma-glutamate capsule biosynthesis protein CapA/YwtB (metallophosphatase superfamily)